MAATIIVASSRSQMAAPQIVDFDKFAHFSVYGLLGSLVLRCRTGRHWAVWAVLIVSAFGGTDELHQSFTPGRSMEWADWICDTTGAALAVSLYARWTWYRRLLECRLNRPRAENSVPSASAPASNAA